MFKLKSNMENFEKASKLKLRFRVGNSLVGVEDLWDYKLEDLDVVATVIDKELKESSGQSFLKNKKSNKNAILELKLEVVKQVIVRKEEEEEAKVNATAKRKRKAYLLEIIEEEEGKALRSKSLEELKAEYASLED